MCECGSVWVQPRESWHREVAGFMTREKKAFDAIGVPNTNLDMGFFSESGIGINGLPLHKDATNRILQKNQPPNALVNLFRELMIPAEICC